jgi:hypothetical protein
MDSFCQSETARGFAACMQRNSTMYVLVQITSLVVQSTHRLVVTACPNKKQKWTKMDSSNSLSENVRLNRACSDPCRCGLRQFPNSGSLYGVTFTNKHLAAAWPIVYSTLLGCGYLQCMHWRVFVNSGAYRAVSSVAPPGAA